LRRKELFLITYMAEAVVLLRLLLLRLRLLPNWQLPTSYAAAVAAAVEADSTCTWK
jgi:hypothetical protein